VSPGLAPVGRLSDTVFVPPAGMITAPGLALRAAWYCQKLALQGTGPEVPVPGFSGEPSHSLKKTAVHWPWTGFATSTSA
jgi:hypothetical protein